MARIFASLLIPTIQMIKAPVIVAIVLGGLIPSCVFHAHHYSKGDEANRPTASQSTTSSTTMASSGGAGASAAKSNDAKEPSAPPSAVEAAKSAFNLSRLERELKVARMRHERAKVDASHQSSDNKDAVERAEKELGIAREGMKNHQMDEDLRVQREKLQLEGAQDNVRETIEELDQLIAMYKENDIADKTKEIVIKRNERRVERARASLAIQQKEMEHLISNKLPVERRKVEMELHARERALEVATRQAAESMKEKEMAIINASGDVARLEFEIETARREAAEKK